MSVAFPVGIGIALVLGVVLNYIADPIGNASVIVHGRGTGRARDHSRRRGISQDFLAVRRESARKAWSLSVACGVLMGFFYRFVAASMYADFARPEEGKVWAIRGRICFRHRHFPEQLRHQHLRHEKAFRGSARVRTRTISKAVSARTLRAFWAGSSGAWACPSTSSPRAALALRFPTAWARARPWSRRCGASSSGRNSAPLLLVHRGCLRPCSAVSLSGFVLIILARMG